MNPMWLTQRWWLPITIVVRNERGRVVVDDKSVFYEIKPHVSQNLDELYHRFYGGRCYCG